MVKTWSIAYTSGTKVLHLDAPELTMKLWTDGYQFAKANVKITSRRRGNKFFYRSSTAQSIDESNDYDSFT